jgi:hypothetical protein
MNTAIKHPPRLPGTPQEGNLSVAQASFIPSSDVLELKGIVDGIAGKVGGAIEVMKARKEELLEKQLENQRKIEEIALLCEQSWNDEIIPFATLIQKIGNVNEKDFRGDTALMMVARNGHTEITKLLLNCPEILVNEKNNSLRYTALMWVAYRGHTEITKLLLARPEILVNEKDSVGDIALMMAAQWGHTEITKLLLARLEILVNEKDSNGHTALIWPSYHGHAEIIKLLLADPRLKLEEHDQWKKALKQAKTPEIKALFEAKLREQGIPF